VGIDRIPETRGMNCINDDDRTVNEDYIISHARHHLEQAKRGNRNPQAPVTTLTYAQSIDGCIATSDGNPLQLSNQESQTLTHQLRALHDAILVGINTVLNDDPSLTVRLVAGQNPQPVVVDSQLRFPLDANLLQAPCVRPIVATGMNACRRKESQLVAAGVRVIRVPQHDDGLLDLFQLLIRLPKLGLHSVMIEGGARIITSMLADRLADQLLLTISPRFVGGLQAIHPGLRSRVDHLPSLSNVHYQTLAGDLIIRGDLDREDSQVS
jgi:GTP cyclohydrolase II